MCFLCSKPCRSFSSYSWQNQRLNLGSGRLQCWGPHLVSAMSTTCHSHCLQPPWPLVSLNMWESTLTIGLLALFGPAIQKMSFSCVTCSFTSAEVRLNAIFAGRFFQFELLNIGMFSPNPHAPYLPYSAVFFSIAFITSWHAIYLLMICLFLFKSEFHEGRDLSGMLLAVCSMPRTVPDIQRALRK